MALLEGAHPLDFLRGERLSHTLYAAKHQAIKDVPPFRSRDASARMAPHFRGEPQQPAILAFSPASR
jgi:hypothetical protein